MKVFKSLLVGAVFAWSALALAQYEYEYDYSDDEYDNEDSDLPHVEIPNVEDLQALGRQARAENKVIFLEMSASYCGYCRTLEDHIIKPMILSGDYDDYVLIRKLDIDRFYPMKDFDGSMTNPSKFAFDTNASLTPTLLFLDSRGDEVSPRIVGVNTLELYGEYVDIALLEGHRKITR